MPDLPGKYHLILLRHGESSGNLEGRTQGQIDTPLTEMGRRQAAALARRWQAEGITFDRIFSSPLLRARHTAEMIASALPAPVEFNPDWMERDYGLASGLNQEEIKRQFPISATIHPYYHFGQNGESRWEMFLRAGRALQDLLDRPPGRYLVVSHGGLLNMAMYAILGIPPQANISGPRFIHENAAFTTLTYDTGDASWRLLGFNDTTHLHTL